MVIPWETIEILNLYRLFLGREVGLSLSQFKKVFLRKQVRDSQYLWKQRSNTIAGTALGLLNGGAGLLGAVNGGWNNNCAENTFVNRYELSQEQKIADLQAQVALRDANTYNDQKLLEVYKYFDSKIEGINASIATQAVYNATQNATIGCMQNQINELMSLTKLVVPNSSVCPGYGDVTIKPSTSTTASQKCKSKKEQGQKIAPPRF